MRTNIFDRLSFLSLFLVVVLLPFFFLPGTNIPIGIGKGALLVVGLTLSIIFWGFARFFDGKIIFSKSVCLLGAAGVIIAIFLSAVFSSPSEVSFFGIMFDIGTFYFVLGGFLLMLMSSIVFKDLKNARIVLFGSILSGAVLLVFQIIHLFLPQILSLGILAEKTSNLLGSWNDLGIFAGFLILVLLLMIEFFSTTKIEKLLFQILIVLGMILIAAVNFLFVWKLLGIFALIIFVYVISITFNKKADDSDDSNDVRKKARFPVSSFFVVMIALLFFISGSFIGGIFPNRLGLSNNEISPSFTATMGIAKSVLKDYPILGIGPNKFSQAWAQHKPISVNATGFWDISFEFGSGLLPTLALTTGYLGILAWLVFFILFIVGGVKSIFSSIKNNANWETMSFFVLSLYLFISCFFYSGGTVLFLLALAFAGAFVGLSTSTNPDEEITLSFLNDHRKGFSSMLFIVLLVVISFATSFKYLERFISFSYFRGALSATTIEGAEASIGKALSLYKNDLYLRTYAQTYLIKLDSLVKKGESLSEADKALLQSSLDQAVNGAQEAIRYNPQNYFNFKTLGSLYQSLASFGVKDVNSKAVEAYKIASTLNPGNPGLPLSMASASFADKKNKEAKDYANIALTLKPDYVDALIFLSQVASSEGDTSGAISYAQKALDILPENKDLIKYLDSPKSSSSVVAPSSNDKEKTENNSTKKN